MPPRTARRVPTCGGPRIDLGHHDARPPPRRFGLPGCGPVNAALAAQHAIRLRTAASRQPPGDKGLRVVELGLSVDRWKDGACGSTFGGVDGHEFQVRAQALL